MAPPQDGVEQDGEALRWGWDSLRHRSGMTPQMGVTVLEAAPRQGCAAVGRRRGGTAARQDGSYRIVKIAIPNW
jgi:hypothetical protein